MSDPDTLVKQSIQALKSKQKARARRLLERALSQNERHEMAWLWMSAAVDEPEEQEICLENVLAINPNNQRAQKGLQLVRKKLAATTSPQPSVPAAWEEGDEEEVVWEEAEPMVQVPDSWEDEDDGIIWEEAEPEYALSPQPAGIFAKAEAERAKRGKSTGLLMQATVPDYPQAKSQRSVMDLLAAWGAALIFDGKNAYRAELEAATIGRTMLGVVISSMLTTIIPTMALIILIVLVDDSAQGQAGGLLVAGFNETLEAAVVTAPFQVIAFFTLAFGMSLAARATGDGGITFYDRTHVLSIAYSASTVFLSILATLLIILSPFLLPKLSNVSPDTALVLMAVVGVLFTIYPVAILSHSMGVAHRSGFIVGFLTVLIGLFLTTACIGPTIYCLLGYLMAM